MEKIEIVRIPNTNNVNVYVDGEILEGVSSISIHGQTNGAFVSIACNSLSSSLNINKMFGEP